MTSNDDSDDDSEPRERREYEGAMDLVAHELPYLTPTRKAVVALAVEVGPVEYEELEASVGVSKTTAAEAVKQGVNEGLLKTRRSSDLDGTRGAPRKEVLPVVEPDGSDKGPDNIGGRKEAAIRALAEIHWMRGVSSATSSQVASRTPVNSKAMGQALYKLTEEGVVEHLNPDSGSKNRYRLVGAGEYAPYRTG